MVGIFEHNRAETKKHNIWNVKIDISKQNEECVRKLTSITNLVYF